MLFVWVYCLHTLVFARLRKWICKQSAGRRQKKKSRRAAALFPCLITLRRLWIHQGRRSLCTHTEWRPDAGEIGGPRREPPWSKERFDKFWRGINRQKKPVPSSGDKRPWVCTIPYKPTAYHFSFRPVGLRPAGRNLLFPAVLRCGPEPQCCCQWKEWRQQLYFLTLPQIGGEKMKRCKLEIE